MSKNYDKGKFDFNHYAKQSTPEEKHKALDNQYKDADFFVLSDPMMYRSSGGSEVLTHIAECAKGGQFSPDTGRRNMANPCTWKLKLLKHTDGREPKPGDRIEWVTQRHNTIFGKKIGTTQAREIVRRGDADKLTDTNVAILDKDLCFVVGYEDAAQLLNNNGVYFRTGYPISTLPENFRSGRYHNWRYVEVPPWNDPKDVTPWIDKPKKKAPKPRQDTAKPKVDTNLQSDDTEKKGGYNADESGNGSSVKKNTWGA